jgi:hypothetical protein
LETKRLKDLRGKYVYFMIESRVITIQDIIIESFYNILFSYRVRGCAGRYSYSNLSIDE